MYLNSVNDRRPAWHRDAKWLTGLGAVILVALATLALSLTQVTAREPAQQVLAGVLQQTLLPAGLDDAAGVGDFHTGLDYTPGEPFLLLPGVDVAVEPQDLTLISPPQGRRMVAASLAESFVAQGLQGVLEQVEDARLREQLEEAATGPLREMLNVQLDRSLLPSGLDDGSRLANWRMQGAYAIGEPVQPIVGVFVLVDPNRLEALTNEEIGVLIVSELTHTVVHDGLPEAQALVTNPNLHVRLTETVEDQGKALVESVFSTLLIAQEPVIEERLTAVRERLEAARGEADQVIDGIQLVADTEGLNAREANLFVLEQLAEAVYEQGVGVARELSADEAQTSRLERALLPFGAFTRDQHDRFARLSWLFGAAAVCMLLLMVVFSSGLSRLAAVGTVLVLAAATGTILSWQLGHALAASPAPGQVQVADGIIAYLSALSGYLGTSVPASVLDTLLRNHLVVLVTGASLIALFTLLKLLVWLRPRRARF